MLVLNTNTLHNVLNLGLAVLAGLESFNWISLFDPTTSLQIAAGIGLAKLTINIWRDGFSGLIKVQPPVTPTVVAGV